LFARAGKVHCKLNILSCIQPIATLCGFPCKDIYSVCVEDVQIFVEKRRNVFNFHLFDGSLDIPDPQLLMSVTKEDAPQSPSIHSDIMNTDTLDLDKILIVQDNGKGGLETSFEMGSTNNSVEKKANEIVSSMLGAVSSLGRAVNEGGKKGFEKALKEQKVGIVEKLKKFQERKDTMGELFTSSNREKNVMTVMKEMGKAMEKNVSHIQEHFDSYKKPPPKKKGYIKKANQDIYRVGFIILSDVHIFTKNLLVSTKSKTEDSDSPLSYLHDENELLRTPPKNERKLGKESLFDNDRQNNAQGWSIPIWLKHVQITSPDLCPIKSMKDIQGQPSIGLRIDDILDILMKKMMTEIAKTNSGKILQMAWGDVFNWIKFNKVSSNFQT